MTERFVQIGQELGELLLAQVGGQIVEAEIYGLINTHRAMMMPLEGWPGSNETKRKAAEVKAEVEDEDMIGLNMRLAHCQERLWDVKAQIDGLKAERQGLEWQIRRALVIQMAATSGLTLDLENTNADIVFEEFQDRESTRAYFEMPEDDDRMQITPDGREAMEEPFGDYELIPEEPDELEAVENADEMVDASRQAHNHIMTMQEIVDAENKTGTDATEDEEIPF